MPRPSACTPRVAGRSRTGRDRRVYRLFVRHTENISSTLYAWQPKIRRARRPARGARRRLERRQPTTEAEFSEALRQFVVDTVTEKIEEKASSAQGRQDRAQGRAPRRAPRPADRAPRRARRVDAHRAGPAPPPLHAREIATVAFGIADAEGLEAVSMRRIATELGAGTMTLLPLRAHEGRAARARDRRGDGRGRRARRRAAPGRLARRDQHHRVAVHATRCAGIRGSSTSPTTRRSARTACGTSTSRCRPSRRCPAASPTSSTCITAVDEYVFGFCIHERSDFLDRRRDDGRDDRTTSRSSSRPATTRNSRR